MKFNEELFKREYLCEWVGNAGYTEAYKLWLWYNYHCELYDSKICTGKNEYEDYMPASIEEHRMVNSHAFRQLKHIEHERSRLRKQGIDIRDEDWQSAKKHFYRYKLKALKEEYKCYFEENID